MLAVMMKIAGGLILGLVGLNAVIPIKLNWRRDLARLSLVNRQVFELHAIFLVLVLGMMGVVCLFFTDLLLDGQALARLVLAGMLVFWVARLVAQWCFYDWSLWWGKGFEGCVHAVLTCVWVYLVGVCGWALWG